MQAIFSVMYEQGAPKDLPDLAYQVGEEWYGFWSCVEEPTNGEEVKLLIETSPEIMAQLKATPGITWIEDLLEA